MAGVSAASGPHNSAEKYFVTPRNPVWFRGFMRCAGAASAPAKVILVGEHFVVWGSRALATAISLRAHVRVYIEPASRAVVEAFSRNMNIRGEVWPHCSIKVFCNLHVIAELLKDRLEAGRYVAEIESDIPIAAGLGSSAAVATAFAAALLEATGHGYDKASIFRLAFEAEKIVHGRPSGIDNAVSVMGGTIIYRIGARPEKISTRLKEAYLVVIDTRVKRSTRDAVAKALGVKNRLGIDIEKSIVNLVNLLVDAARDAAVKGDFKTLGTIMRFNHGLLNGIRVAGSILDNIVNILDSLDGVYGAKMTGAGLGGVAIALLEEESVIEHVRERLKPLNVAVLPVEAEAEGVRVLSC